MALLLYKIKAKIVLKNSYIICTFAAKINIYSMKKLLITALAALCCTGLRAQNAALDKAFERYQQYVQEIQSMSAKKDYDNAVKISLEAIAFYKNIPKEWLSDFYHKNGGSNLYYNLACWYSLQNKTDKAIAALDTCINVWEFSKYQSAAEDPDFDNIRKDKRFQKLMETLKVRSINTIPKYVGILRQAGGYEAADTAGLPHFAYEDMNSQRLKDLREYFHLDSIAGNGDELSQILNLMRWVHNSIRHDGSNYALAEFDAIDLYHYHKATGKGVNCRMLAITLNEFYLAMGFKSRYVTCLPKDKNDQDCHVINAVWSKTLGKWLWIDPTFNAYLNDENGVMLSIAQVRERIIAGKPVALNADANWNNQSRQTKEDYIDNYMAKNLYWLQCPVRSCFNAESRYYNRAVAYVSLCPVGEERGGTTIHDAEYFWQEPQ
jgi:hypothetical protein